MTSASPTAPPRPQPAVVVLEGRESELEILVAALLRARRSALQLIWISGEAGVGKTALAAQLREPAQRAGGRFVQGKCEQFGGGTLLQAPRQALGLLVREQATTAEPARASLAVALRQALGPDGGALVPLLPELQDLTGPLPEPTPLEAHEQPQRLLSLLVVLVLDDLHWADPLTLALITALLEAPDLNGLLLLGLFRHNELGPGGGLAQLLGQAAEQPAPPLQLALANLTTEQVQRLLASRLPSPPDALPPLSELVQRNTGGNPFFVLQLLNAVERHGLLGVDQLQQRLAGGDVVAFLSGDLSQLPPASRELLQCLACLGSQANLALLAQASGIPLLQLPERLQPALEQGVLVCAQPHQLASADPGAVVVFGHDRLQQAVATLADAAACRARQLAMARRLQAAGHPLLAAQHFAATTALLTAQAERRRVATLLHQAGSAALDQGDFPRAELLLEQALALLGTEAWQQHPDATFELKRQLHQLAYGRADYGRADAIYSELQRWARSPRQLLEAAAIQVMALSIPLQHPQQALEGELEGFLAMVQGGGLDALPPLPPLPARRRQRRQTAQSAGAGRLFLQSPAGLLVGAAQHPPCVQPVLPALV